MWANFQQEGKVQVLRHRRNSFPSQGVSTEAQFFRTTGGTPSGPRAFEVSSPERAEKTSEEEILIVGMKKSEGGGAGGINPESSKVELAAKV